MSLDQFLLSADTTVLNYPEIRPTLDLNFARVKTLDPRITFTRASSGSYFGADGILKYAGVNEARFDHNPLTGESLGLLVEEQRTNLRLNSATYQPSSGGTPAAYTVDQVAPDGTTTGSRQTAATPRTFEDYTGIANALYTFSFYCRVTSGTAAFSIQLKNAVSDTVITSDTSPVATTAWRRFTISGTTAGATPGARVELVGVVPGFVLWGAQLEVGAFPTSYIPTTTAAATRNADVASITGANFSSWYRQDEGTVFAEGNSYGLTASSFPTFATISDGTANNRLQYAYITAGLGGYLVLSGGTTVAELYPNSAINPRRAAFAAAANNYAVSFNGASPFVDTAGNMPVGVNQMQIGNVLAGSGRTNNFFGTIKRLTYWPKRLPNSQLRALTR